MSLKEKLDLWRSKNDITAPLQLDHSEQKQLNSKFKHALKSAPEDARSMFSDACSKESGKNAAKQAVVKAWILDGSWGDTFVKYNKTIKYDQSMKTIAKPLTRRELEAKYSEEEISALLESGGITQVSHSGSTRVKLYVDNGYFEKTKEISKQRLISKEQGMKEDDLDAIEEWDMSFDNMHVDLQQAETLFLKDCKQLQRSIADGEDEAGGKKAKNKVNLDDLDVESSRKLNLQASNVLNAKTLALESQIGLTKKNPNYTGNLKKTSQKLLARLGELYDTTKMLNKDGGSVQMFTKHLKEIPEALKEVSTHMALLKRL
jgi:hypothetical protein